MVGLIAAVLDSKDGAGLARTREMGYRVGEILATDPAEFVTTMGFVGAALAELAAEAIGTTPEDVLASVLTAATARRDWGTVEEEEED